MCEPSKNSISDLEKGIIRLEKVGMNQGSEPEIVNNMTFAAALRAIGDKNRLGYELAPETEKAISVFSSRILASKDYQKAKGKIQGFAPLSLMISLEKEATDNLVHAPAVIARADKNLQLAFLKAQDPYALAEDLNSLGLDKITQDLFAVSPEQLASQEMKARELNSRDFKQTTFVVDGKAITTTVPTQTGTITPAKTVGTSSPTKTPTQPRAPPVTVPETSETLLSPSLKYASQSIGTVSGPATPSILALK